MKYNKTFMKTHMKNLHTTAYINLISKINIGWQKKCLTEITNELSFQIKGLRKIFYFLIFIEMNLLSLVFSVNIWMIKLAKKTGKVKIISFTNTSFFLSTNERFYNTNEQWNIEPGDMGEL